MFPPIPTPNSPYGVFANTKSGYTFFQRKCRELDFSGLRIGEFVFGMFFSSEIYLSSFFDHILGIVRFGPQKQMSRIHTRGIVATMKNTQSFWNRSVVDFPRHSMGEPSFSILTGLIYFIRQQQSVPLFISECRPNPTTIGLMDFGPESFFGGFHSMYHSTITNQCQGGL